MLHEFLRSQDDSQLCVRVLYDHESVVRHVAYDLATLYYRFTSLAHYIYTLYKQSIFQTRLDFQERTMDAAVSIPPHQMVRMLNVSSRASTRTMTRMIVRSPYVQSH